MIMEFICKANSKRIEVKNVNMFTTDSTCLGVNGYGVNYKDGTYNCYSRKEWELILVKEE